MLLLLLPIGDEHVVLRRQQDGLALCFGRREQRLPVLPSLRDLRVFIKGNVALDDAREDRLQRVVVLLRDRIKLVRVAACAVRRGAGEGRHRLRHQVIAVEVFEVRRCCLIRAVVKHTRAEKSERSDETRLLGKQTVGGELLAHEPRPRLVVIQRFDDIVAKPPRVIPRQIVPTPMRLREMNRIQPVPRPALAMARRSEQPIHQMLVSLRIAVLFKRHHLGKRRRQPVQIEIHSPNERATVRFRRRCQLPLREPRPDEAVHRMLDRRARDDGKRRFHQWLQ